MGHGVKRKNYRKRINYVIAVFTLVLFYTWLGQYAHTPGPGSDGQGSGKAGAGDVRRKAPPRPGIQTGLVADFPADVPVYSPSQVQTSRVAGQNEKARALLQTGRDIENVSRFYKAAVRRKGWRVTEARFFESGQNRRFAFRLKGRKANRRLTVQLLVKGPGTEICLKLGQQQTVQ